MWLVVIMDYGKVFGPFETDSLARRWIYDNHGDALLLDPSKFWITKLRKPDEQQTSK